MKSYRVDNLSKNGRTVNVQKSKRPEVGAARPRKRERTHAQLVDAALRVIARKDAAALSILELAHEASVSHGTVYNYFRTREEIVEAVALRLADDLAEQQSRMFAGLEGGAVHLTLAVRSFILRAAEDHAWGLVFLRVSAAAARLGHSDPPDAGKPAQGAEGRSLPLRIRSRRPGPGVRNDASRHENGAG